MKDYNSIFQTTNNNTFLREYFLDTETSVQDIIAFDKIVKQTQEEDEALEQKKEIAIANILGVKIRIAAGHGEYKQILTIFQNNQKLFKDYNILDQKSSIETGENTAFHYLIMYKKKITPENLIITFMVLLRIGANPLIENRIPCSAIKLLEQSKTLDKKTKATLMSIYYTYNNVLKINKNIFKDFNLSLNKNLKLKPILLLEISTNAGVNLFLETYREALLKLGYKAIIQPLSQDYSLDTMQKKILKSITETQECVKKQFKVKSYDTFLSVIANNPTAFLLVGALEGGIADLLEACICPVLSLENQLKTIKLAKKYGFKVLFSDPKSDKKIDGYESSALIQELHKNPGDLNDEICMLRRVGILWNIINAANEYDGGIIAILWEDGLKNILQFTAEPNRFLPAFVLESKKSKLKQEKHPLIFAKNSRDLQDIETKSKEHKHAPILTLGEGTKEEDDRVNNFLKNAKLQPR